VFRKAQSVPVSDDNWTVLRHRDRAFAALPTTSFACNEVRTIEASLRQHALDARYHQGSIHRCPLFHRLTLHQKTFDAPQTRLDIGIGCSVRHALLKVPRGIWQVLAIPPGLVV
jgi:hypothetical protein